MSDKNLEMNKCASSSDAVRRMQFLQRVHDENFHPEIARLDLSRRMVHLVLHLAKYSGDMRNAELNGDHEGYRRAVVDAIIIASSGSTALHINLIDVCVLHGASDPGEFRDQMMISVGRIAKAVESLDHVENYPSRKVLNEEFPRIFWSAYREVERLEGDVIKLVNSRLSSVRSKHIFYREIMDGLGNDLLE